MGSSCWGKRSRKWKYFSKKEMVTLVGFGFSQIWKKSVMLRLLGKLLHLFWKNCSNCQEKLWQLSWDSCHSCHKTAVALVRSRWGQLGDFRLLERTFGIYFMDLAKNGKISFKGILLFLVQQLIVRISTLNGWWYHFQPSVKC